MVFPCDRKIFDGDDDRDTLRQLLPVLRDIVDHHVRGTRFGIGVDASDGLLRQEAKRLSTDVDGREGRRLGRRRGEEAVEINALFYNALRLWKTGSALRDGIVQPSGWLTTPTDARFVQPSILVWRGRISLRRRRRRGRRRFILSSNQVLAMSLTHPVLDGSRWHSVLDVVRQRLLTPYGLRTLAPGHRLLAQCTAICARATRRITRAPSGHGSSVPTWMQAPRSS